MEGAGGDPGPYSVRDTLAGVPHIDRLTFRVKGPESFVAKAQDVTNAPKYSDPLVEVEDQVAGRIIVFFLSDIAHVRRRLEAVFTTVERVTRRPERDAEFGYESEHMICIIPPQVMPDKWNERDDVPPTFEIQIRTIFMHAYAEPQRNVSMRMRQMGCAFSEYP